MTLDNGGIYLLDTSCTNGGGVLWDETIPEAEEIISYGIDGFLARFFCEWSLFFDNTKIKQSLQIFCTYR